MLTLNRDLRLFADDRELARGCALSLSAREETTLRPALHSLEIRDLSDSDAGLLAGCRRAEVRSGDSILAFGAPAELLTRTVQGRRITSLVFSPGLDLWETCVSLSVSAGMKVSDTIRTVLSAAGRNLASAFSRNSVLNALSDSSLNPVQNALSDSSLNFSLAAYTAPDPPLARPQAFFGRACDALTLLAETAGGYAFLSPAGLCVTAVPESISDSSARSLPSSALLSAPIRTGNRLLLSTTMTGWPLGGLLTVSWQGISRTGLVVSRFIQADNRDGPWKSELELELCS